MTTRPEDRIKLELQSAGRTRYAVHDGMYEVSSRGETIVYLQVKHNPTTGIFSVAVRPHICKGRATVRVDSDWGEPVALLGEPVALLVSDVSELQFVVDQRDVGN